MATLSVGAHAHGLMMREPDNDRRDRPDAAAAIASRLVTERLFESRTVLLFGEITMALAQQVTAQLLALASLGREPIRLWINSPGGHVESGDTIHDVVRFIDAPVHVFGTGWVASAAALVYVAAERENRFALPNTRFLLHEPRGGAEGSIGDIEIEVLQALSIRERTAKIFARATGQSYERVCNDTRRNYWLSAEEARTYGLVHRIIERTDPMEERS